MMDNVKVEEELNPLMKVILEIKREDLELLSQICFVQGFDYIVKQIHEAQRVFWTPEVYKQIVENLSIASKEQKQKKREKELLAMKVYETVKLIFLLRKRGVRLSKRDIILKLERVTGGEEG